MEKTYDFYHEIHGVGDVLFPDIYFTHLVILL